MDRHAHRCVQRLLERGQRLARRQRRQLLLAGAPRWTSEPNAVTPGELLTLQVSIRSTAASSAASAGLVYLDSLGQVFGRTTAITAPLTTAWTTLESAVTVSAAAAAARVELSGFSPFDFSTAGSVTFDEVAMFGG